MAIKTVPRTDLKVGKCEIIYRNVESSCSNSLRRFAHDLDSRAGRLFDVPLKVDISVSSDVGFKREEFSLSPKCPYKGYSKPKGWEVRRLGNGYIFYVPKVDAFLTMRRKREGLAVTLDTKHYDLGILRHGVIEMMQMSTTNLLVHSVAVEKDGKGILFVAESGSGKTTLQAQLINSGYRFNLITEGYSLISEGHIFQVKTAGLVRNGALWNLGLKSQPNLSSGIDVEFKDYVGTVPYAENIDLVVSPHFNLDGKYSLQMNVPMHIEPIYRDWPLQMFSRTDVESLVNAKEAQAATLPEKGAVLTYSTDTRKTAELFDSMVKMIRC